MQTMNGANQNAGWMPAVVATNGAIPLRVEPTELGVLLRSSLEPLARQAAESGIELRVDTIGEVPALVIDREKVAWAVVTLVGNALRYVRRRDETGPGGSILVHVAHDSRTAETSVSVHDDGPGVPPEKLPHLFVRRPGALHAEGLALSLVRDVVGAHNGRIEVESCSTEAVHGTSITLRLSHRAW